MARPTPARGTRPGPKGVIDAEPLSFKGWPLARAKRREKFIHTYCVVPRGHGAGKRFRLREFQQEMLYGAFAPGVRTALISMPRSNGKTMWAAAVAWLRCSSVRLRLRCCAWLRIPGRRATF